MAMAGPAQAIGAGVRSLMTTGVHQTAMKGIHLEYQEQSRLNDQDLH